MYILIYRAIFFGSITTAAQFCSCLTSPWLCLSCSLFYLLCTTFPVHDILSLHYSCLTSCPSVVLIFSSAVKITSPPFVISRLLDCPHPTGWYPQWQRQTVAWQKINTAHQEPIKHVHAVIEAITSSGLDVAELCYCCVYPSVRSVGCHVAFAVRGYAILESSGDMNM